MYSNNYLPIHHLLHNWHLFSLYILDRPTVPHPLKVKQCAGMHTADFGGILLPILTDIICEQPFLYFKKSTMLQTYFCKCTCCYGPDHITNVRRQKPRTYTMATGQSPLTCGNKHNENISLVISLFQIFPRLPSVRTPEVNKKILVPTSGL